MLQDHESSEVIFEVLHAPGACFEICYIRIVLLNMLLLREHTRLRILFQIVVHAYFVTLTLYISLYTFKYAPRA